MSVNEPLLCKDEDWRRLHSYGWQSSAPSQFTFIQLFTTFESSSARWPQDIVATRNRQFALRQNFSLIQRERSKKEDPIKTRFLKIRDKILCLYWWATLFPFAQMLHFINEKAVLVFNLKRKKKKDSYTVLQKLKQQKNNTALRSSFLYPLDLRHFPV